MFDQYLRHEGRVVETGQIAVSVAGHLVERVHGDRAHLLRIAGDDTHVSPCRTVPGSPVAVAGTNQVLVQNVGLQSLRNDGGVRLTTDAHQQARRLDPISLPGAPPAPFLCSRSRHCPNRRSHRPPGPPSCRTPEPPEPLEPPDPEPLELPEPLEPPEVEPPVVLDATRPGRTRPACRRARSRRT